jgi:hypothetical protein
VAVAGPERHGVHGLPVVLEDDADTRAAPAGVLEDQRLLGLFLGHILSLALSLARWRLAQAMPSAAGLWIAVSFGGWVAQAIRLKLLSACNLPQRSQRLAETTQTYY